MEAIKAEELRIGNVVSFDGEIYTINGIRQPMADEPYDVELKTLEGMFIADVPIEDLEGVPLTKAELEDLGLKNGYFGKENEFRVVCECRYVEFSNKCKNKDAVGCVVGFTGLQVHRLQNLAFALTGQQLTK